MDKETVSTPTPSLRDGGRNRSIGRKITHVVTHPIHTVVEFVRARIVGYLVVFSLLGLAFAINQETVNRRLAQQDKRACLERTKTAQSANATIRTTVLVILSLANEHQKAEAERAVAQIKPLPLPNCEHL